MIHFDPMLRGAVVTLDDRECAHRMVLTRTWSVFDDDDEHLNALTYVMLNPSIANSQIDDPTVKRCISFALREGFGGFEIYNLFSLISTSPRILLKERPLASNSAYLELALKRAAAGKTKLICAWGGHAAATMPAAQFRNMARAMKVPLWCLGRTNTGAPRHPLYRSGTTPLESYS